METILETKRDVRGLIEGCLLHGGRPDARGDVFPVSELRSILEHTQARLVAGEDIWAVENFNMGLSASQGRLAQLWMVGDDLHAKVELFNTPAGECAMSIHEPAVAFGGTVSERYPREGGGSELRGVTLTLVSVVPRSQKLW